VKQNCDLQVKDQVSIHQDVAVQCEEESSKQSYDDLEGNIGDLNKFLINKDERNCANPKEIRVPRYKSSQISTIDKRDTTTK
jgi:hypothetical protein